CLADPRALHSFPTRRSSDLKNTLVYKYGGSDVSYNRLGGMHLLYWNSIQDAKRWGLRFFDLGRTDVQQAGLVIFKKRWGAVESRSEEHTSELQSRFDLVCRL